jgi:pimeloyl-ACP methyl ester carboxylesterase
MAAVRWARRRFHVDENRIHVTGVSRGAHLAWDIGLRHADRWASLCPMAGGPRLAPEQGQNNLRFLENAVHLSIRDLQGLQDDPDMLFNLRLAFAKLKALGAVDIDYLTFPDLGHAFRMDAVDWKAFFLQARRNPLPARVVRQCATEAEGRAFWAEVLDLDPRIREEFVPRVEAEKWNGMDEDGRKEYVAALVEHGTARLEIHMRAPGVFEAKTFRVKRFRILLTPQMIGPDGQVTVTWNGKVVTKKPPRSRQVLAAEFAEHFDRSFLPVAEMMVP